MKKTVITILIALLALAFVPSCVSKEVARNKEKLTEIQKQCKSLFSSEQSEFSANIR